MKELLKKLFVKKGNYYDYSLLFIVFFLLGFGLVMLYSTSAYNSTNKYGYATFYLNNQLKNTIIGLVGLFIFSKINYRVWKRLAVPAYFISMILLLMVYFTPLGISRNGQKRWLNLIVIEFQPSEAAKIALIMFVAYFVTKAGRRIKKLRTALLIGFMTLPLILLVAYANLSTGIILAGIVAIMLFVAYPKYWPFVGIAALGSGGIYWLVNNIEKLCETSGSYRFERILVWLNPEAYSSGKGYQTLQALYAIGSGGLFGKGLGNSIQKLSFIPEAQNDMIFSIICEELGLFGAVCVILLFGIMIWRFMVIANNAPDLFGSLLVVGILGHISLQVILNVAVVTNTIPNTGVTLPFISYGGTSICFLLAEMGIALSVSRQIKLEK